METILIFQTIAIYIILFIFIVIVVVLKKQTENLQKQIEEFKKELKPTIDKANKVIDTVNTAAELGKKGMETAVFAAEKVKDASIMIENLCLNIKAGYDLATGKVSLLKLGVQKGLTAFVANYLKNIRKKEEEK
jgi:predicted Holliday junction resolvase-like endonuclease